MWEAHNKTARLESCLEREGQSESCLELDREIGHARQRLGRVAGKGGRHDCNNVVGLVLLVSDRSALLINDSRRMRSSAGEAGLAVRA